MLKKMGIFAIGLLLILSIACKPKESSAGVKKIEFWVYEEFMAGAENSPIGRAVAQFEQDNNCEVDLVSVPYGSDSFRDKFIQTAQAGAGPDMIQCNVEWNTQLAAMQLLAPLDDLMPQSKKDQFFPGPLETGVYQGSVYGVPFHTDIMSLYYNRDRFAEVGLDPDAPPETWEDFRSAAIRLTDVEEDKYGYGLLGGWGGSYEWLPFLYSNGGSPLTADNTKAAFNSSEGIESLEFFLGLITDDGVVPEAALAWKSWDDVTKGLASGYIAMAIGSGVIYQKLKELPDEPGFDVAPIPMSKKHWTPVGGSNFVIAGDSENKDIAYSLADFLTSSENLWILDEYSRTSARRDNASQRIAQEDPKKAREMEGLAYSSTKPVIPEWLVIDYDHIQPAMMEVIHKGNDVQETFDAVAKTVDEEVLR